MLINIPCPLPTLVALMLSEIVAGQFSAPQLIHDPSVLPQGVPVCFADFDGDLVEDAILFDGQRIVLGQGTAPGQYEGFALIDSGAFSTVLPTDVDADGDMDLLYRAQLFGDGVGVFVSRNQGNGTFLTPEEVILDQADFAAIHFAVADMDGDGDGDLITTQILNNAWGIFWYPYETGTWLMNDGVVIIDFGQALVGFQDLDVADLDLDGDNDLVACGNLEMGIWLNGSGAMQFTLFNTLGWTSASLVDLNGDPAPDLVLTSLDNKITLTTGNGDGTWAAPTEILLAGEYAPSGLTVGDVDQDGDDDIVYEDTGNFEWHENDGAGAFQTHPIWNMQGPQSWQTTHLLDMDADGDLDLFCSIVNGLFALYNDGQQVFSGPVNLAPDWRSTATMVVADMDGDGVGDVVADHAENNQLKWYRNTGGAFDDPVTLASYAGEDRLRMVADLDQDGARDLLTMDLTTLSISWRRTMAGPSVSGPLPVGQPTGDLGTYVEIQCHDMDGDEDLDVVAIAYFERRVSWFENDGTGVFGAEQLFSLGEEWHLPTSLADLDGDGAAEFIFLRDADNRAVVVQNDGTGAAITQSVLAGTESMSLTAIGAFDVDQDQDEDLLLYDIAQFDHVFGWLPNLGNGTWGTLNAIRTIDPGVPEQAMTEWRFEDIDGDSDPDLVYVLGVPYYQGHGYVPNLGAGVFDTTHFTLFAQNPDLYVVELNVLAIANAQAPFDLCMNIGGYPHWVQNLTESVGARPAEVLNDRVEAAPNPFSFSTVVTFPVPLAQNDRIELTDTYGRLVWVDHGDGTSSIRLQNAGWNSGTYTLRVLSNHTSLSPIRLVVK